MTPKQGMCDAVCAYRAHGPLIDQRQTKVSCRVGHCQPLCDPIPSLHAGTALTEYPDLRFAVGTFDSWTQLRNVLARCSASRRWPSTASTALPLNISLRGKNDRRAVPMSASSVQSLAFPGNRQRNLLHFWSTGRLALRSRLRSGAPSLRDALGHWLVPRHAAHFQKADRSRQDSSLDSAHRCRRRA